MAQLTQDADTQIEISTAEAVIIRSALSDAINKTESFVSNTGALVAGDVMLNLFNQICIQMGHKDGTDATRPADEYFNDPCALPEAM